MCHSITVMNAKGGVGKTTLVLALAETLSAHHDLKVLVIDSDAHASLSSMLLPGNWLATMQAQDRTFVDYLIASVLKGAPVDWRTFVVSGVSDVDDARSIELLLGGGHLTLFEREVSKGDREADLRQRIRTFLAEACEVYDLILIDSAPGLSVLTECWLREADFCLSPAKPDYLSTRGLQFLQQFGERDTEMGFAENLGVIISMKDAHAPEDEQFDRWLRHNLKAPLLQAGHSAHDRAADRRLFFRAHAVLWREVSRQGGPGAAAACRRAARPPPGNANQGPRWRGGPAAEWSRARAAGDAVSGAREERDAASCVNTSARP